jgi:hypothetical protein
MYRLNPPTAVVALAHQLYHKPGPLAHSRTLVLRAEWSRSESGFRDDSYHAWRPASS